MTFLFPGFLMAAGLVSLGVVVLHFLVTQQPKSEPLPTVRFVPDLPARSTSVAIRPSDLWLLLLRVIMIMLIGAAFAQPLLKPKRQKIARLVMVDVSRDVGNLPELLDSARRYTNGASAVVLFDSTARQVPLQSVNDSLQAVAARPRSARRGQLSPALIATLRAASRAREGADSLDLVVVSPFASEERDAATSTIRALWPGRIVPVRVAVASDSVAAGRASSKQMRTQWADSGRTTMWVPRPHPDTVGAVRAGSDVLVYPFPRSWRLAAPLDSTMHVYARWVDGEPAAIESIVNGECVRSIAFSLPSAGDAILRPNFVRFRAGLNTPCGTMHDVTPLPSEFIAAFQGPVHLAPVASVKPRTAKITPLVPWLLAAALLLALFELLVRRPGGIRGISRTDEPDLADATRSSVSGRAA
jgi:hypothetical protein